jgi:hypothetical protein
LTETSWDVFSQKVAQVSIKEWIELASATVQVLNIRNALQEVTSLPGAKLLPLVRPAISWRSVSLQTKAF